MQSSDYKMINLILEQLKLNQTDLARFLGLSPTYFTGIKNGATLSNKTKALIVEKLNVNPTWLETGEGEIFIGGILPNIQQQTATNSNLAAVKSLSDDAGYWKRRAMELEKQVADLTQAVLNLSQAIPGGFRKLTANCFPYAVLNPLWAQKRVQLQLAPR